jgi:trimethyllysine dioxygenase
VDGQDRRALIYEVFLALSNGVQIKYGFSYVNGCPVSPEKTQELLERIAFIRITHYGTSSHLLSSQMLTFKGGFYDFTSDLTMKDTAYTSLALDAHTDTTYFSDPAGLQMFHLLSHTDGSGGKSLLVDGFRAAKRLKSISKLGYEWLCKTPIMWHASGNEGITITPGKKYPVFTQADQARTDVKPRLLQVRWNNDDRGVVDMRRGRNGVEAEKWYYAARLWSDILKEEKMQYWAQLEPGRPLSMSFSFLTVV